MIKSLKNLTIARSNIHIDVYVKRKSFSRDFLKLNYIVNGLIGYLLCAYGKFDLFSLICLSGK